MNDSKNLLKLIQWGFNVIPKPLLNIILLICTHRDPFRKIDMGKHFL